VARCYTTSDSYLYVATTRFLAHYHVAASKLPGEGHDEEGAKEKTASTGTSNHIYARVVVRGRSYPPVALQKANHASGVTKTTTAKGDGERYPVKGDMCVMHYTGMLPDGSIFDTSKNRGPLKFKIGTEQVRHATSLA
jgi:hypothetical protein